MNQNDDIYYLQELRKGKKPYMDLVDGHNNNVVHFYSDESFLEMDAY